MKIKIYRNKTFNFDKLKSELLTAGFTPHSLTLYGQELTIEFLTDLTSEEWISIDTIAQNHVAEDMGQVVSLKIKNYQSQAGSILTEIYKENTLAGITKEQSSEVFRDFNDVIFLISQGAFPTALFNLQTKQPSGFATQERINGWIQKLITAMS